MQNKKDLHDAAVRAIYKDLALKVRDAKVIMGASKNYIKCYPNNEDTDSFMSAYNVFEYSRRECIKYTKMLAILTKQIGQKALQGTTCPKCLTTLNKSFNHCPYCGQRIIREDI